jgi:hypothetical protein
VADLTEVVIGNMALARIGVSRPLSGDQDGTLANCTDTSVEKEQLDLWYDQSRQRALTEYAWQFARKSVLLTQASDGVGEIWDDEWDNAYELPTDCLMARRFVNDRGLGYYRYGCSEGIWPWGDDSEWKFVIRAHKGAKVILTDVSTADANLEYTENVTDVTRFTRPFAAGLAWLIASELALPLDVNVGKAQAALQTYYATAQQAAAFSANEEIPLPQGDQQFLNARGF